VDIELNFQEYPIWDIPIW